MTIQPEEWTHPVICPVPETVTGVASPCLDLCGPWSLAVNPEGDYWLRHAPGAAWQTTVVPGDLSSARKRRGTWATEWFVYRREIDIPADYAGRRVLLRCEGSYGLTRVWADGVQVAEHADGFVTWTCDLTAHITAGQPCLLTLAIENGQDDVSGFNQGGLVRGLSLMALPELHVSRLHVETCFTSSLSEAVLEILLGITGTPGRSTTGRVAIRFTLTDPDGHLVLNHLQPIALNDYGRLADRIKLPLTAPRLWDAEHPWLYRLCATLIVDGSPVETAGRQVGFRQIRRDGNRLLVNGVQVKLRGVCRHDISPLNGRTVTETELRADVQLFKAAHVNYIRTSHYPPSEAFLDLCDQIGMYVEDEVGLAFIARSLKYTQKSPAHTSRYLTFFSELVERDRSHPSVLIWSLANESFYGPNFAAINAYAHREDPSRPTKFSYPMTMQEEDEPVDIWSVHYPNYDTDLAKKQDNVSVGFLPGRDMPVLHDECIHVPCYNREEHRRDPSVRTFWGESIRRFWDGIWHTPGALGGAIWAGIDEVSFAEPGRILEWGIIDIWRRPKPEYWLTRKAYSPVRLPQETLPCPVDGPLVIPIENRYCHTNLSELTMTWQIGAEQGTLRGPDLAPGQNATLSLPARRWQAGDVVQLAITDRLGQAVDEYELQIEPLPPSLSILARLAPDLQVTERRIIVCGQNFSMIWDRTTGLISAGVSGNERLITGGPDLHVVGVALPPWSCQSCSAKQEKDQVIVTCVGSYGDAAAVTFTTRIGGDGRICCNACLDDWRLELPQTMKIRVGIHPGGLDEWGIAFELDHRIEAITWLRRSDWSGWPADHIGRVRGTARRNYPGGAPAWAVKPQVPWSQDGKSPVLFGKHDPGLRGSNDFRAMKHQIIEAELWSDESCAAVHVHSDSSHSLRLELVPDPASLIDDRDPRIRYGGSWHVQHNPAHLGGTETVSFSAGDTAMCEFTGTGIAWIGSADVINGMARIWIDGRQQAELVSQRVAGPEFAGSSIGFDKKYRLLHYAVTDLPYGRHTLCIEVTGEKSPEASDCLIGIDCLRVLSQQPDPVRLLVLQDYNYPRLAWGNYLRPPVLIKSGDCATACLELASRSMPDLS